MPPDAQKRNFNENDILGDFDRDEKETLLFFKIKMATMLTSRGDWSTKEAT